MNLRIVRPTTLFAALLIVFQFIPALHADADDLDIQSGDAYIELRPGADGFDLYVRDKPGLGSILITESSADPEKKADSFAFRTWDYNEVNGDEKRILNGEFLESERPLFFLLDSTPEENELLERAYRIYIPFQLTYGYPWSREGQVEVHRGTWLNIRAFELPYADYEGGWTDNPFVLSMKELPPPPAPEVLTVEDGPVEDIEEAVERIGQILDSTGGNIDVVLAVDTTVSMKDDVGFIKESLVPMVRNRVDGFAGFRVGLLLYRDYKEAYLTRNTPFSDNLDDLQSQLDRVTVSGGRDLPEAVNEALYAALTEYDWIAPERIIIQVGDAPAHVEPRGAITRDMVEEEAASLGVSIFPIRLPGETP
ncbi:MAG: vWA domain-containing protein [Spirochaetaceae bacterium]|nr:vWA domain-containing protein [Spirochaetaceae bacterium]